MALWSPASGELTSTPTTPSAMRSLSALTPALDHLSGWLLEAWLVSTIVLLVGGAPAQVAAKGLEVQRHGGPAAARRAAPAAVAPASRARVNAASSGAAGAGGASRASTAAPAAVETVGQQVDALGPRAACPVGQTGVTPSVPPQPARAGSAATAITQHRRRCWRPPEPWRRAVGSSDRTGKASCAAPVGEKRPAAEAPYHGHEPSRVAHNYLSNMHDSPILITQSSLCTSVLSALTQSRLCG
jgi:hypothetical protein